MVFMQSFQCLAVPFTHAMNMHDAWVIYTKGVFNGFRGCYHSYQQNLMLLLHKRIAQTAFPRFVAAPCTMHKGKRILKAIWPQC